MDISIVGIFKLQEGHKEIAKHKVPRKKTLSTSTKSLKQKQSKGFRFK